MRYGKLFSLFLIALIESAILFSLSGCGGPAPSSSFPPPAPAHRPSEVEWPMERNGLRYKIEASDELNLADGEIHGLTVSIFLLKEPDDFQAKVSSAPGIDELLGGSLEKFKALGVKTYYMQPGGVKKVVLDRPAGAKYLGVVAGYNHLSPDLCAAVLPFPVHHERKGIIFKEDLYTATPADIGIYLGPESLSLSGVERVR